MELLVTTVNNSGKSFMLDVVGVSGYNDSCHKLLGIVQICHLWRQEAVNLKIVFFFVKKNAQGTSKTDIEVPHMNYRFCCKPKLKKRVLNLVIFIQKI